MGKKVSVLEGSMAVAEAVRACNTDVIAAYPISPQTHIVEDLSAFAADGRLHGKYICADSEFSAASAVYGASAAGARAYTASSSQGLMLMTEVVYNIAGMRLPVVFTGVNRTVSPPISINNDHQDTMTFRDCGIIQIHAENIQEAYDAHIQAFKIAEDHRVLLPVMICMDGWTLTHSFTPVTIFDDADVQEFIGGPINPLHCLNPKDEEPISYGVGTDTLLLEYKYQMFEAMKNAETVIEETAREYKEKFGFFNGGLVEPYKTEDAEVILLAMGSVVSSARVAVDELRAKGQKAGLLKIRSYRPFPAARIVEYCKNARVLAVLDKAVSIGIGGVVAPEVKASFANMEGAPLIKDYIASGGKYLDVAAIKDIFEDARNVSKENIKEQEFHFVKLLREYL